MLSELKACIEKATKTWEGDCQACIYCIEIVPDFFCTDPLNFGNSTHPCQITRQGWCPRFKKIGLD